MLGSVGGGLREGQRRAGSWGEITWGVMPDIGDGDGGSKPHCHVCTYATITCTPELKVQLKKKNIYIYIYT